jgi:hypothetical protein
MLEKAGPALPGARPAFDFPAAMPLRPYAATSNSQPNPGRSEGRM